MASAGTPAEAAEGADTLLRNRACCTAATKGREGRRRAADRRRRLQPEGAGPLRIGPYLEPFTLAIAQLANESDAGPEIAYDSNG